LKCRINLDVGEVVSDTHERTDYTLRHFGRCAEFPPKRISRDIYILKQFWFPITQWKNRRRMEVPFQKSKIILGIKSNDGCRNRLSLMMYFDLPAPINDMVIGDDVTT
jgi:hypothetical protein